MRFGVFVCNTEVKNVRIQNKAFVGYFEIFDLVMFFGVENVLFIGREPFSKMYVV